jgi:hypothetical protein
MRRRSLWAAALVTALAGCGGSETAPEPGSELTGVTSTGGGGETGGGGADFRSGNIPKGYPAPKTDAPDAAAPTTEAPKPEGEATEPAGEAPKIEEPKGEDEAAAVTLSAEEIAEIKKLPEAEQAIALKQKVCPISTEHLGSMGAPIKVTAGDKTAFLCCKGCQEDFDKDPQAALAKLGLK